MNVQEERVRIAAFQWLEKQTTYDVLLSWNVLRQGFVFNGNRISLVGPQGIWKPRVFARVPLSITTSPNSPYSDSLTEDGFLIYKYRGEDPNHRDNVGLREAGEKKIPLIYFYGITTGEYLRVWPIYIIEDNPPLLSFVIAVDDKSLMIPEEKEHEPELMGISEDSTYYRCQYITSTVRTRLHQKSFRMRVLEAYKNQCAFCQLKHAELLDAAHITPDSIEDGVPTVNNGLSLCKIHHAAYNRHLIEVNPDYQIVICRPCSGTVFKSYTANDRFYQEAKISGLTVEQFLGNIALKRLKS
jgi:putative restriction endonuclease